METLGSFIGRISDLLISTIKAPANKCIISIFRTV
jgi:hypothetical protein